MDAYEFRQLITYVYDRDGTIEFKDRKWKFKVPQLTDSSDCYIMTVECDTSGMPYEVDSREVYAFFYAKKYAECVFMRAAGTP